MRNDINDFARRVNEITGISDVADNVRNKMSEEINGSFREYSYTHRQYKKKLKEMKKLYELRLERLKWRESGTKNESRQRRKDRRYIFFAGLLKHLFHPILMVMSNALFQFGNSPFKIGNKRAKSYNHLFSGFAALVIIWITVVNLISKSDGNWNHTMAGFNWVQTLVTIIIVVPTLMLCLRLVQSVSFPFLRVLARMSYKANVIKETPYKKGLSPNESKYNKRNIKEVEAIIEHLDTEIEFNNYGALSYNDVYTLLNHYGMEVVLDDDDQPQTPVMNQTRTQTSVQTPASLQSQPQSGFHPQFHTPVLDQFSDPGHQDSTKDSGAEKSDWESLWNQYRDNN